MRIENEELRIHHSPFCLLDFAFYILHSAFNLQPWPIGHATRTTKQPI
ncbi:MAG: hypothetical protein F6J90_09655 [Moorea sp. SIOASIH]|nr:hypothetical protein [Moorena sp. SIOASIH]